MNRALATNAAASSLRITDLRALAQLATAGTLGITDLVEAMHAGIVRPFELAPRNEPERTARLTRLIYGTVRATTRLAGGALDVALALPATREKASSIERDALISALNGVIGDRLSKMRNSLAIETGFCVNGQPIAVTPASLAALVAASGSPTRLVILVHGLCMNDRQWLREGHDHGAALARDLNYLPIYLRYNSGRRVSINGGDFATQLETLVHALPMRIEDIAIVAHSMGGLVTRSAFEHGAALKHRWMKRVKHVVFLGTPHLGAPLERGGHWIDLILGATPFAKPLARIGKVRSAGIVDLRDGSIHEDSSQRSSDLPVFKKPPRGTRFFSIAATTASNENDWRSKAVGDGLVPVPSALAIHDGVSPFPAAHRAVAPKTNHMQLLSDATVYRKLRTWLE